MEKVEFRWSPYKEDIGIFGKKGEGKTSRARVILDTIPNLPRWIWSPQRPLENFQGYGTPVTSLDELKHGAYIWNGTYNKENFLKFCERAFFHMRNIVLVFDDVHEYVSKQFIPPEFETLILSGRNRGISSIFISPMPAKVHNSILAQCSHIFAYNFNLQAQIEWLRDNYFGNEAWLLLAKDLRNKYYTDPNSPDLLPKYSYLYRKDTDTKTQIIMPNQAPLIPATPQQVSTPAETEQSLNDQSPPEKISESNTEIQESDSTGES